MKESSSEFQWEIMFNCLTQLTDNTSRRLMCEKDLNQMQIQLSFLTEGTSMLYLLQDLDQDMPVLKTAAETSKTS